MFVRVKDPTTRHEFDVPETDWRLRDGIFARIKTDRYPPVNSPRRAKHYIPRKTTATPVESSKEPADG